MARAKQTHQAVVKDRDADHGGQVGGRERGG